jgi:hypothetical protein
VWRERARHDWLAQFLDLPNGIPSHDTIGAVWSRIDPAEFESALGCDAPSPPEHPLVLCQGSFHG